MLRVMHALALGAIGAGLAHIAILLMLPTFSDNTVWSRMVAATDLYEPARLDQLGSSTATVDDADPLFQVVACRFDLADGLVRFQANGQVLFWSASIYDRAGQNIYSFNDRSSPDSSLDFVVLTPTQMTEVRKGVPDELQQSNFVETDTTAGIAVIRAFAPDETWAPTVRSFLDSLSCQPV